MRNIRLYMFQTGTQVCKIHHIKMNQEGGEHYEIPVPWFLLTHPAGSVIIDGALRSKAWTIREPTGVTQSTSSAQLCPKTKAAGTSSPR